MALLFCEREFQDAWRELDKPQVGDGWELFAQTTGVDIYRHYVQVNDMVDMYRRYVQVNDMVDMYRRYAQDSGLYEYKVFGSLSTTPELCADVYMDLGYRKQWDSYVKELYEMDCGGLKAIYWEVKYPFPLSNRDTDRQRDRQTERGRQAGISPCVCVGTVLLDHMTQYVYVRERRDLEVDGRKIWVVLAKSSEVSQCAEKPGVIRVKDYKQSVALESDGSKGSKVFMNYFDNPGGNIPTWLVNWAAKSGVPAFLTDMQKACGRYTAYCRNRK
ncbi:hypothetical protein P4O66_019007 [Electrophorus voltai]|uniref:Phosphatidylcholine transfer protein n=1 Tax=Electrophorus voltai TaxID=2609070 RepID=A0AAD8YRV7_9TELE|nr:hypothetical protein P4O66_019007 [Electrophorus voltai]